MKPFRRRVSVVVVNDERVLIVKRNALPPYQGTVLELPGGGIEEGQTPEDAVKAECLEEVGVAVKYIRRLPSLVHRSPFPVLKEGEGTPVQIERRKLFSGVESVAYIAEFEKISSVKGGTAEDAASWTWMQFDDAIKALQDQLSDNRNHEMRGVFEHSLDAVKEAKKVSKKPAISKW